MTIGRFNRYVSFFTLILLWVTSLLGCVLLPLVIIVQSARDLRLFGLTAFVFVVAIITTFLVVKGWLQTRQKKRARAEAKKRSPVTYLPRDAYKPKPPLHRVKRTR